MAAIWDKYSVALSVLGCYSLSTFESYGYSNRFPFYYSCNECIFFKLNFVLYHNCCVAYIINLFSDMYCYLICWVIIEICPLIVCSPVAFLPQLTSISAMVMTSGSGFHVQIRIETISRTKQNQRSSWYPFSFINMGVLIPR